MPWFRPWFHLVPLGSTARTWRFRLGSADICLGSALGSTWFHLVPLGSTARSWRFRLGSADICLGSALGSTWFHGPHMAVSLRECGHLPWFRPWFRPWFPLVPLGSVRFHDPHMEVSRGECGHLPWFRPWFHLVPRGSTTRTWRFRLGSAGMCLGSALGSTWFHAVPRPAHGGLALARWRV